jgi:hypothetical protein
MGIIDLAIGALAGYAEVRKQRQPLYLPGWIFLSVAMLLMLTAIAFGLAAAFWALMCLGVVQACLLTGAIALVASLLAMEIARRLLRA